MTPGAAAVTRRHDVVIVGGGLVGCGAAFHLTRAGASVLLVEQGDPNRKASGQNAGSMHFQLEHRLLEHGRERTAEFAQVIPLSLAAMEDWRGLESLLDADLEVVMHGGLMVAESDDDVALLETKDTIERDWQLPTAMLSGDEARRRAPYLGPRVRAAGWCEHEGHANPRLVGPAFLRKALEHGLEITTHTAVRSLERRGDEWVLGLDDGGRGKAREVRAGQVLNSAGAWMADVARLAHLHLPVFPVPLQMNITARSAPMIGHLVQHVSRRLSIKQVRDGNVLIGGGWPARFAREPGGRVDFSARPLPVAAHVRGNLAVAADVIPGVRELPWLRTWTGTVGVTSDQLPVLGEVPEAPGFFVAGGGSTFTLGPTCARLISSLMLEGRSPLPIDLYSPARFSHINGFMASA